MMKMPYLKIVVCCAF